MPLRSASRSTDSTKLRWSIFMRNAMTSPPSPQPKQWKVPWVARTLNDGVFSSWNGHRPFSAPPPARRNDTYSPTRSSTRVRSRTCAMSLSRIRPATMPESRRVARQSAGRSWPDKSYDGRVTVSDDVLAEQFAKHRSHLIGVAYRLTGTLTDAEDAVQEAWLRLSGLDERRRAEIRELRAWLTTVVGRICLDRLRSATAQREKYVGPWLPEPIVTPYDTPTSDDPLDTVVRADEVRMAAMVVLDRLTPEQRVAFVLHDAFSVPFGEIGEILGVPEATARQYASRGRRAAASADPPARIPLDEQRALVEELMGAIVAGDVPGVVKLLHPDAVL